jgi:hypothetical protein
MQKTDNEKFVVLIEALAANFGVEATESRQLGFWMGLNDLDIDAVEKAVVRAVSECDRMPTVKTLRELRGETTTAQRAIIAWAAVQKAARSIGSYRSVNFDDPVANATIRNLGGWERLCSLDSEEFEKWARKDFERVYCSMASAALSDEAAAYLPGAHEKNNTGLDYDSQPALVSVGLPALPGARNESPRITDTKKRTAEILKLVGGVA